MIMDSEQENPARGCVYGIIFSAILWFIIGAVIYLIFFSN